MENLEIRLLKLETELNELRSRMLFLQSEIVSIRLSMNDSYNSTIPKITTS